jgi:hypothetical protein
MVTLFAIVVPGAAAANPRVARTNSKHFDFIKSGVDVCVSTAFSQDLIATYVDLERWQQSNSVIFENTIRGLILVDTAKDGHTLGKVRGFIDKKRSDRNCLKSLFVDIKVRSGSNLNEVIIDYFIDRAGHHVEITKTVKFLNDYEQYRQFLIIKKEDFLNALFEATREHSHQIYKRLRGRSDGA